MKSGLKGRRGIASVIGTMLFVAVLMVGLGAFAYVYSLQAQAAQAAQQAQQLLNQKGKEALAFQAGTTTLSVLNDGPTSAKLVAILLKYSNGTVYNLNSASAPAFTPVTLQVSTSTAVKPMVPSGSCGLSTCLSKYNAILVGGASGDAVGLVTSLGNVFWYPTVGAGPSYPHVAFGYLASNWSPPGNSGVLSSGFGISVVPTTHQLLIQGVVTGWFEGPAFEDGDMNVEVCQSTSGIPAQNAGASGCLFNDVVINSPGNSDVPYSSINAPIAFEATGLTVGTTYYYYLAIGWGPGPDCPYCNPGGAQVYGGSSPYETTLMAQPAG